MASNEQQHFTVFNQNGPPRQLILVEATETAEPTPPIWAVPPPMVPARRPVPGINESNPEVIRNLWGGWTRIQRQNWYRRRWGLDDVQMTNVPSETFRVEGELDSDDEYDEEDEEDEEEEVEEGKGGKGGAEYEEMDLYEDGEWEWDWEEADAENDKIDLYEDREEKSGDSENSRESSSE